MTTKRALVLAGGGVAGIAWETGVLAGIADESPATAHALVESDVLIGTSAGAAVAAQLGSGAGLDALFARQVAEESAEIDPGVGIEAITEAFAAGAADPGATVEQRVQRIGAAALAATTVPAPVRRSVIAARLPSQQWPQRPIWITAVDAATGALVIFDRNSGVDLVDAVAASCAVPGAWPPVEIDARHYIDGGIASSVNLAVAREVDAAVALVPSAPASPSLFGGGGAGEVADYPNGAAFGVFADGAAVAAFGANPLDPACRVPSAWAGRAQGRSQAAAVAGFLDGL